MLLEQLKHLDKHFKYRQMAPAGRNWFDVLSGSIPVLVSAPHACMHLRDDHYKLPEEYTGAIAQFLAKTCECHSIAAHFQSDEDPNWQSDGEYKQTIADIVSTHNIKWVIDLHGMTNRYHMGVAIGTMNGKSCNPSSVVPAFTNAGFTLVSVDSLPPRYEGAPSREAQMNMHGNNHLWRNLVVDHPRFTGGLISQTVTRYATEQLGIRAAQIELASINRVVHSSANDEWPYEYMGDEAAIQSTVQALQNLIISAGDDSLKTIRKIHDE